MIETLLSGIDRSAHTSQGSKPGTGMAGRSPQLAPQEILLVGVRVSARTGMPTTRFLNLECPSSWAKGFAPEIQ